MAATGTTTVYGLRIENGALCAYKSTDLFSPCLNLSDGLDRLRSGESVIVDWSDVAGLASVTGDWIVKRKSGTSFCEGD